MHKKITSRSIVWIFIIILMLSIPVSMLFTNEIQSNEAIAYAIILLCLVGFYELLQVIKKKSKIYKSAFAIGFIGAFLLIWINGAVGIIGSEDNPANLLYGGVF